MFQSPLSAYQFIWRDFTQPSYQYLVLTLNGYQVLLLLAFVSAIIAYTQTRWWIITRYLLIRLLRPVQLPDAEESTSLHHLSQAKAITVLISREKRPNNGLMTTILRSSELRL